MAFVLKCAHGGEGQRLGFEESSGVNSPVSAPLHQDKCPGLFCEILLPGGVFLKHAGRILLRVRFKR